MKKVLLAGGGTGGHLYPLLSVVKELRKKNQDIQFFYVGPVNKMSRRILEKNEIKIYPILTGKWRRYFSLKNLVDVFKFPFGILQSLVYVLKIMPDVVFSKGGYGSVAPVIVARIYFIPILTHESDAVPGIANRFLAKISDKIAISFEETKDYFPLDKVIFTGNPIREDIKEGDKNKARTIFNLHKEKPVIFVLGGSQGSRIINREIAEILPRLLNSYQIIHQVGEGKLKEVDAIAARLGIKIEHSDYHAFEYLEENLIEAYAVADLIISRAGASSLTEIAASQKPSILVPLGMSANNHQVHNAFVFAKRGGAFVMKERNFKGDLIIEKIDQIMVNENLRRNMEKAVTYFYDPQSAAKIAKGLLYLTEVGAVKE